MLAARAMVVALCAADSAPLAQEVWCDLGRRELHFSQIKGDFKVLRPLMCPFYGFLGRPGSVCASADLLGVLAWCWLV